MEEKPFIAEDKGNVTIMVILITSKIYYAFSQQCWAKNSSGVVNLDSLLTLHVDQVCILFLIQLLVL